MLLDGLTEMLTPMEYQSIASLAVQCLWFKD